MIKTLLICHEGMLLNEKVLPRWMASFSHVSGIILLENRSSGMLRRIKREISRVGVIRFIDVMLFRIFYRIFCAKSDDAWHEHKIQELLNKYGEAEYKIPVLRTSDPNSEAAYNFIQKQKPDIMIVRCKQLLKKRIYNEADIGAFVMHPGICPEYRNAHGCFWALVNGDLDKVGMTLLKIDEGVDTGPVYGYYMYEFNETKESHIRIQWRVVYENLDSIAEKLIEISSGTAMALNTSGRKSKSWGQPWFSAYIKWKRAMNKKIRT